MQRQIKMTRAGDEQHGEGQKGGGTDEGKR